MGTPWPSGFERIPDEAWTTAPVEELAQGYDTVEDHGWYANLDPTVDALANHLEPGDILVDYSGGTGILADRLLDRLGDREIGVLVVDSSRKFLRLALDKLAHEERIAFAHVPYLKDEGRVATMQEVLDPRLLERGVEAIASTNAIHLYYDLPDTLASWRRVLDPGGVVHIQSGNIHREDRPDGLWVIDATVEAMAEAAETIVAEDDRFAPYREALADEKTMAAHRDLREKYFLPIRPLSYYIDALKQAGFSVEQVEHRAIRADVEEWLDFLSVYHEGIVGWMGGAEKITGQAPGPQVLEDRLAVLEAAADRVFDGASSFQAEWTYITCRADRSA